MDFKAVIENFKTIMTKKYFCFEGRANRAEFWQFVLVTVIVNVVLGMIPKIGPILTAIWGLALILPSLGVTARRFHDRGKSGWLQLLCLIPLIGALIVVLMCIPEGDKETNAYGEPVA